jgi:hypothetical protein
MSSIEEDTGTRGRGDTPCLKPGVILNFEWICRQLPILF